MLMQKALTSQSVIPVVHSSRSVERKHKLTPRTKLLSWVSSHNADFPLKFERNKESNEFKAATISITISIIEIEPFLDKR